MRKYRHIFLNRLIIVKESESGGWTITKPGCQYRPWFFAGVIDFGSEEARLIMIGKWSVAWSKI